MVELCYQTILKSSHASYHFMVKQSVQACFHSLKLQIFSCGFVLKMLFKLLQQNVVQIAPICCQQLIVILYPISLKVIRAFHSILTFYLSDHVLKLSFFQIGRFFHALLAFQQTIAALDHIVIYFLCPVEQPSLTIAYTCLASANSVFNTAWPNSLQVVKAFLDILTFYLPNHVLRLSSFRHAEFSILCWHFEQTIPALHPIVINCLSLQEDFIVCLFIFLSAMFPVPFYSLIVHCVFWDSLYSFNWHHHCDN